MKVESVALDSIQPHPKNPRQGDVGAISLSLERFGQYQPIVVQKSSGHIIAGNHRWQAASALGWNKMDVVRLDVDDTTAESILVADNRTADIAVYDDAALSDLLQNLATEDALMGTGWDSDDLDDLLAKLQEDAPFGDGVNYNAGDVAERAARYETSANRSVLLDYPIPIFRWVVDALNDLRNEDETNAAVVLRLIESARGEQAPT